MVILRAYNTAAKQVSTRIWINPLHPSSPQVFTYLYGTILHKNPQNYVLWELYSLNREGIYMRNEK